MKHITRIGGNDAPENITERDMITIKNGYRCAISTKFVGPTNFRGARIVATTSNGHRHTIPYDYSLSTEDAHAAAARDLANSMQWTGTLIAGGTKTGYVYVFAD